MNKFTGIFLILFLVSFGFLLFQFRLTTSTLLLQTDTVGETSIDVYVAKTVNQLYKGLGNREKLNKDGMLLVFPDSQKHGIVMRNMKFPIDIVWINYGVVVDVVYNAPIEPDSSGPQLTPYFPRKDANLVLELPAGNAKKYGITEGSKIIIAK